MLMVGIASGQAATSLSQLIAGPAIHMICQIYRLFVGIAGGLAVLVIVYAGIRWLAESDDPAVRKSSKEILKYALMALLVIMLADVIVSLVTGGVIIGDCSIIDTWTPGPTITLPTTTTGPTTTTTLIGPTTTTTIIGPTTTSTTTTSTTVSPTTTIEGCCSYYDAMVVLHTTCYFNATCMITGFPPRSWQPCPPCIGFSGSGCDPSTC